MNIFSTQAIQMVLVVYISIFCRGHNPKIGIKLLYLDIQIFVSIHFISFLFYKLWQVA